jgi:hypothetical protein
VVKQRLNGTANAFEYSTAGERSRNEVASVKPVSWNHVTTWLRQIDALRRAA